MPAWLNDPLLYHNRGDSTFAGESTTYGDFSGLDDLFTEQPKVRDGMIDVYKQWVDFGIDGFRIDTVKHVNMGFWQRFSPAMLAEAKKIGNDDFFMFGEVYDARPEAMSPYTTKGRLPATLDFGFQDAAKQFAQGKPTTVLRDLFAGDDYYTDTDSNAYEPADVHRQPRHGPAAGDAARRRGAGGRACCRATGSPTSLMYLVRGQPVVYYGDEQGMVGESGGDQNARQDMFPTKTKVYSDQADLLGRTGSIDRFDPSSSLYRDIARMARLRQANPALADGTQVHRYASSSAGVFAVSRIDRDRDVEYLVAANNSTSAKTVDVATYSRKGRFTPLYGTSTTLRTDRENRTSITVPPLSVAVWKGAKRIDRPSSATVAYPASPQPGATLSGRQEVGVSVPANTPVEVSFGWREAGQADWHLIGTDDAAPYRVFHDVSDLPKGEPDRVPRRRHERRRQAVRHLDVRRRGRPGGRRRRRRRRGRPGDAAVGRERARRPQQRDGLRRRLGPGLRPGPGSPSTPRTASGRARTSRPPVRTTPTRRPSPRRGTRTTATRPC
nr:alpha-amylase family glycosyl hydrolase [Angustibacter aerolatus]